MGKTLIIKCTKCHGLTLAAAGLKTKTCPYCCTRIELKRTQTLAKAPDAFEASKIIKKLKSQQA